MMNLKGERDMDGWAMDGWQTLLLLESTSGSEARVLDVDMDPINRIEES